MTSCKSSKCYENTVGAVLAVLVVTVTGSLLNALFSMQVLV